LGIPNPQTKAQKATQILFLEICINPIQQLKALPGESCEIEIVSPMK
jgi:hypothetical protein